MEEKNTALEKLPQVDKSLQVLIRLIRASEIKELRHDLPSALIAAKELVQGKDTSFYEKPTVMIEPIPIDCDFKEAATFFSAQMFGKDRESIYLELKRRYEEDDHLDSLVCVLARHRTNYSVRENSQRGDIFTQITNGKYSITVDIDAVLREAKELSSKDAES